MEKSEKNLTEKVLHGQKLLENDRHVNIHRKLLQEYETFRPAQSTHLSDSFKLIRLNYI